MVFFIGLRESTIKRKIILPPFTYNDLHAGYYNRTCLHLQNISTSVVKIRCRLWTSGGERAGASFGGRTIDHGVGFYKKNAIT